MFSHIHVSGWQRPFMWRVPGWYFSSVVGLAPRLHCSIATLSSGPVDMVELCLARADWNIAVLGGACIELYHHRQNILNSSFATPLYIYINDVKTNSPNFMNADALETNGAMASTGMRLNQLFTFLFSNCSYSSLFPAFVFTMLCVVVFYS